MPARYPLGTFDNAQALTAENEAYNLVAVARCRGRIAEHRVREGLAALTGHHPMLRSRVVRAQLRYFDVAESSPAMPLSVEESRNETTWLEVAEREAEHQFALGQAPLGRCVLLAEPADDCSTLILSVPHALVDGIAMAHLVAELLGHIAGSTPLAVDSESPMPAPADEHFPAAWRWPRRVGRSTLFLARQLADELRFRWRSRGRHTPPAAKPCHCRVLARSLTREETEALVRASRQRRVTLTAILEAAMLRAVVRHRYGDLRLPHRYFSFPLLRRYLEPPVPDHAIRSYITLLRATTEVAGNDDLWRLAATIDQQIARAMARGERFAAALWSHVSMRTVFAQKSQRMATTALSYTGALTLDTHFGELELLEVHAFVSNFGLGPEYTAQARIFRGRLWLDILYLDADMTENEARRIAATMLTLLTGRAPDDSGKRRRSP